MAQRSSRKRRKARQRAKQPATAAAPTKQPGKPAGAEPDSDADRMARGYARGRIKDEQARAALVPLAPGERPMAVTVAFWFTVLIGVANLVVLAVNIDGAKGPQNGFTLLGSLVMAVMAAGMWKARYWAVLGMQALLALTILFASLALVTAAGIRDVAAIVVIIVVSGTLFWYLIKAMARIQMPERPGAR